MTPYFEWKNIPRVAVMYPWTDEIGCRRVAGFFITQHGNMQHWSLTGPDNYSAHHICVALLVAVMGFPPATWGPSPHAIHDEVYVYDLDWPVR